MASGPRLQPHLPFLPGLTLLILEGSQGSQSHGRRLGALIMTRTTAPMWSELPWDPGLCRCLRLRREPPNQDRPQT